MKGCLKTTSWSEGSQTMPDKRKDEPQPRYVVANPLGHPGGVPIITIDDGKGEPQM